MVMPYHCKVIVKDTIIFRSLFFKRVASRDFRSLWVFFAISHLSVVTYFLSSILANRDKLASLSTKFSFALVCSLHGGVLIVTEPKNSADPSDIVGTTDYKSATVSMIPCVKSMLLPKSLTPCLSIQQVMLKVENAHNGQNLINLFGFLIFKKQ
jgi:hypothetical protein